MSTPQQQRLIGQVIADRYRVLELLGEGGMGAVYLAEHLTLHKHVALKVVHAEHAKNPELAARFSREAMATSRIDHPNVISAMDFGTLPDGTAYLAVQLVRGPSLTRVLAAEGPMPWARAVSIGSQIADALCAAHGHGIVHRDLKPDNVLLQYLDDGGELVKVCDFGVAKFSAGSSVPSSARADVTQIGFIVGTPGYMAPEQAVGTAADERSDLYSLGVLLWESLVGRQLWTAPDLQRLVERQLVEVPPRLLSICSDTTIPPSLDELVATLLSRRAADRPSDAATVRDALRDILKLAADESQRWRTGARPVPASLRTETPRGSVPAAHDAPTLNEGPAHTSRPPRLLVRTSKTAWVFASLLLLIVLGATFLVATGRIELRPRGEVAEVAQAVAEQLNLPKPSQREAGGVSASDPVLPSVPRKNGLPAELQVAFEKLIVAETREERTEAARAVLSHDPLDDVPAYARRMAYLQLAQTCEEKRSELIQLAEFKDPRALPLLIRMAQKPKSGCGKRKKEDCMGCLRAPLEQLVRELSAAAEASNR